MFARLFFPLLIVLIPLSAVQKVTFVEDPAPPFIEGEINQKPTGGITLKIIEKIFEKIPEAEAEFVAMLPWKRSLAMVEKGNIDAIMHLYKTPKREEKYYFTNSTYTGRSLLFFNREKHPEGVVWKDYGELEKYNICLLAGVGSQEFLKQKNEKEGYHFQISPVSLNSTCWTLLEKGRVDLFVENEAVAYQYLQKHQLKGTIVASETPLYSKDFYMAFSKNSEAHKLIPRINAAIKELRSEGVIDSILQNKH